MDVDTWAIVELMGHVKLAGRLSEEERFGSKMGRLDIPAPPANPTEDCLFCHGKGESDGMVCGMACCGPQFVTQHFGGGSVYRITYVSEAVARHVARQTTNHEPVHSWDWPKAALTAAEAFTEATRDLPDDEDDDFEPDYS
jgi:hypothetical protein